jgi:hypothetical protein
VTGGPIGDLVGSGCRRSGTDFLRDAYENRSTAPAEGRSFQGSTVMYGHLHQELARQRHREACLQAHRVRVLRAARAERRARRAVEIAVRAGERIGAGRVQARA